MKLVSVIVPMYNVENYIEQCVQTIINQSYSNLEIILIDDGSPDESGVIADRLSEQDERIVVYHKKNGGLSDARNYGIDRANGDYLTFTDSDDFIDSKMIETLISLALKYDAEFVECKNCRCAETDTPDSFIIMKANSQETHSFIEDDKMKMFLNPHSVKTTAWAKLYSKRLFESIRYPVGKYHEDVFTTYKLVHDANKVVSTNYIGYVYRANSNSITTSKFNKKRLDAIEGKIEQAHFIEKHYPLYVDLAYAHIIYACNNCLRAMAKSNYNDRVVLKRFQSLYRKYGKCYLKADVSLSGKFLVFISIINIYLSYKITKILKP